MNTIGANRLISLADGPVLPNPFGAEPFKNLIEVTGCLINWTMAPQPIKISAKQLQDNYRKLKSTQEEFNKALKNNEQTRAK